MRSLILSYTKTRQGKAGIVLLLVLVLGASIMAMMQLVTPRTPTPVTTSPFNSPRPFVPAETAQEVQQQNWKRRPKKRKQNSKARPVCMAVAPIFHGSSPSELRFYDEMVLDSKAEPNDSFLQVFSNGMLMVHQLSAASSHMPEYSGWSETSGQVMLSSSHGNWLRSKEWVLPSAGPWLPTRIVSGSHAFVQSSFAGNYGHFYTNYLPTIAWMREQVSPKTSFLLISNPVTEKFIRWLDYDFFKRIVWIEPGQLVQVKGDLMLFKRSSYLNTHPSLISSFHRWIQDRSSYLAMKGSQRSPSIVYVYRSGKDLHTGHMLNELDVLKILRDSMKKYNRQEELIILDDEEITFQQQFDLFHSAVLIIGAHDSAMSNSLFMNDGDTCASRPQMLEFTCGTASCKVQGGGAHRSSYYTLATLPWLNYHQVDYDPSKSTAWVTYVDLKAFQLALDSIWGKNEGSANENTRGLLRA